VEVSRLDVAGELRLRRWARSNYVSADRRSASWHPIVLDEMRCRDAEIAMIGGPTPAAARYVPLAPSDSMPDDFTIIQDRTESGQS
jgi:hypothetical protein